VLKIKQYLKKTFPKRMKMKWNYFEKVIKKTLFEDANLLFFRILPATKIENREIIELL
jgi:hypothetical protein